MKKTKETNTSLSSSNAIYKKWWFYLLLILCLIIVILLIPIIINESYKVNSGYVTLWDASDVLSFYSVLLSGLISISSLIATIYFSKKDTEKQINAFKAQIKLPFFVITTIKEQATSNAFDCLGNHVWQQRFFINRGAMADINIRIGLKNIGDGVPISPIWIVNDIEEAKNSSIESDSSEFVIKYTLSQKLINNHIESQSNIDFVELIELNYKNGFGVKLMQTIEVKCTWSSIDNSLLISIAETSEQKAL